MKTADRITAKIVLDSISPEGIRLPSVHCKLPRIILAEINTHRVLTRNSRSTRAVPTSRLLSEVRKNPYMPIRYDGNKPGMQAGAALPRDAARECARVWKQSARQAADTAEKLFNLGLHKQWAGRVLEPYLFTDVLITSTNWTNFFGLRVHPDAQPEFECLARKVHEALEASTPRLLLPGQWHLPYIDAENDIELALRYTTENENCGTDARLLAVHVMKNLRLLSAARCARISYKPFNGENSEVAAELERAKKLMGPPLHASPFEHQATPDMFTAGTVSDDRGDREQITWVNRRLHGNFYGWVQNRKLMDGENIEHFEAFDESLRLAA